MSMYGPHVRDCLYLLHPDSGSKPGTGYGVLTTLVSCHMDGSLLNLEQALSRIAYEVLHARIADLTLAHVRAHIPGAWLNAWEDAVSAVSKAKNGGTYDTSRTG